MDLKAIQGFLDQSDPLARSRAFQYFEQLKESNDGWKLSINCLTTFKEQNEQVKFFCFQVIVHYIKTKYQHADSIQQQIIRDFISHWIQTQSCSAVPDKALIQNKAAQIVCMAFLIDYPSRWMSFFDDLLQTLQFGAVATDIYLRILLAINTEIADREIARSQKELETFTLIKDTMRETCVPRLVDSWYHILVTYQNVKPDIVCLCLEVIGVYIAWIDINLIANNRFVQVFVNFLTVPLLRESTCDCIYQIVNKGMDPIAKIKLVESYLAVLEQSNAINFTGDADDEDFIVKLASLVNGMGTALLTSWTKLQKLKDAEGMLVAAEAIHSKTELLLEFLNNEDDEVSQAVIEFAREYLQFLKHKVTIGAYGITDAANVETMLFILINKYKYDKLTDFASQGQDEAMFEEYRKSLKVIFDNLILLDLNLVFTRTKSMIISCLHQWQSRSFEDIEVAITFLYLLGEAVPNCHGNPVSGSGDKKTDMSEMLRLLISSEVSRHGHVAVTLQFFETIVRFEKFLAQEPQHIPVVLLAFLDERGLRNSNAHVRSRTSYLFSRFVKSSKSHMANYTEEILKQLKDLLVLASPENGVAPPLLSPDDQLYLYESAAILIVSSSSKPECKHAFLKTLLSPVAEKFEVHLQKLNITTSDVQKHEIAKCMNHAIAVTSRTSKAFSNQQTMKSCNCVEVYLQALQIFLQALNLPVEQTTLQPAVRQYLHRMVVCLEAEVLPYFPIAAEQLLKAFDVRSIQEFIPLINQIISKFKKNVVPFVQQIFMPFVTAIFNALSQPIDDNDQQAQSEKQLLQRSYFLFIATIVTNNLTEVIASQEMQNLERVLLTIIQGAVDFPDPVAQKTCFSILRKMVELWGGTNDMTGFVEFMYNNIVPACFMAPLKSTFDLSDAQTILALSESALCLKSILDKRGDEFVTYLQTQYLPTLNVAQEQIQEYCCALRSDTKAFKHYLKKART